MISKRHCAVLIKGGKAFIRDFDSTNGTFVNNTQVKGEVEIKNDDILKMGPLEFKVVLEAATPVNKPTPAPAPVKVGPPESDDDIAAMLLSLQDDSVANAGAASQGEIPSGSTVMDIMPGGTPPDTKEEEAKGGGAKKEEKKEPPKPAANTSQAAKAILEKYTRRSRS
jgi:pSer/pThr/pTyr-binding forkhead associated (FHA) protein